MRTALRGQRGGLPSGVSVCPWKMPPTGGAFPPTSTKLCCEKEEIAFMTILVAALLIGVIAGLRALTAPALASWAARLGWISTAGTPLAFMGYAATPWIFTVLAIGELITDKLPSTPSRKVPPQFIARVVTGGLSGATLGASRQMLLGGLVAGAVGAVIGTLGGAAFRGGLVRLTGGKDLPIALLEDAIAIGGGLLIVSRLA